MKTSELIKNFIAQHKTTLVFYIICCILYYPLQAATFTIATGALFNSFSNLQQNKTLIYKLVTVIIILYTVTNLAIIIKEKIEGNLIPRFNKELRTMIFDNIVNKMRVKFTDIDIGEFISRISMISIKWDEVINQFASTILPHGITVLIILGILFYFGTNFGVITIGYMFIIGILLLPRYKKCLNKLIDLRYSLNSMHNDIQDKINNLFEIYIANKEEEEKDENKSREKKYSKKYKDVYDCTVNNSMFISLFNIAYLSIMLYLVITSLYSKKINKTTAISIILLLVYVVGSIYIVFKSLITVSYSYSILKESEQFLNYISDYEVFNKGKNVNVHSKIHVNNVSFKYNQDIVLDQVNLSINKNEKTIIKGVSGSGKSTLIKLICGFYTPIKGDILINDTNIKNVNIENLRSQITMLNQNVKLFNISIYDNISYINNTVSNKDIDTFIVSNKIKLFHSVNLSNNAGQNGNNLSGGQKQMTLILRCLLADKKVVIFDEPTSALDNYHFDIFNNIIEKMNKTIIVITHDSRFDKSNFDNKYHLEKGRLTKLG